MKIYNTITRKEEEFVPLNPGKVSIYACGPTVYNLIHLGNARPICVFDTLRRYLRYLGYDVTYVQNFTDVDDKIIRKANEEGVDSTVISERYIAEYKKDAAGLNVMPADVHPQVTKMMDKIIAFVQTLVDKGYAYEVNGDVYYRTHKFEGYGKLSHQPLEDLEAGARIEVGDIKEHPADFALWKAAKPGEPHWTSPWSEGRPGWHIECSTMAREYLGDTIDIHCGGEDLIFPHHENEIAQSEAANGKEFARYWMHNGFITVDKVKMSKSLNNFFTVRDVAGVYGYEPIRYLMLQSHYRSPINYSADIMAQCVASLDRLYNCKKALEAALPHAVSAPFDPKELSSYEERFKGYMDDDMNTADALSVIFELARDINTTLKEETLPKEKLLEMQRIFLTLTGVLGLLYKKDENEIPQEVMDLVAARGEARKAKDFAKADEIRAQIEALGYEVKETRQGTQVSKKA
ncbi:MAG: cysteine--tRNA ligase [Candidatus Faecivivens sp.]|nr:cysteine--tRNA ligase [Oscillospiraceae bacterium]MDY2713385.1 cysteine--tRNA ligase [Candidatus Faecivivens sp.]